MFAFMPFRVQSIMENVTMMAVPLFIFMGIVLQRTRLAEQLLESMGQLFGGVRGGLAISTVLVGALLAASTGVVGASVVAMGLISLPVMMKYNYEQTPCLRHHLCLGYAWPDHSPLHHSDHSRRCAGDSGGRSVQGGGDSTVRYWSVLI